MNKPKVILTPNGNSTNKVKLPTSQTSPATSLEFKFDVNGITKLQQTKYNQEIDTDDFHIVVVGQQQQQNISPSKSKRQAKAKGNTLQMAMERRIYRINCRKNTNPNQNYMHLII